jgi:hypothetical protein
VLGMVINSAIIEGDSGHSGYYSDQPRVAVPAESATALVR